MFTCIYGFLYDRRTSLLSLLSFPGYKWALPLPFFWSSKHLSLILLIFFRRLTSSLMQRFCLDPRDTTLVLSLNGLFWTSLTNCANCE